MARSGQQRLDATPEAMVRRTEFLGRVKDAEGDPVRCADLMVEAITMLYDANGLEPIGNDGRSFACIETMVAAHCMFGARDAYLRARGSNQANVLPLEDAKRGND